MTRHLHIISHTHWEQSYRITLPWSLPVEADEEGKKRSEVYRECSIVTEVTLRRSARVLGFNTWFDNQVKDHRLRVRFPVPFSPGVCRAGGRLDVVTRQDAPEWPRDRNTHPNWRFVGLSGYLGGIAILNEGLHDYEHCGERRLVRRPCRNRDVVRICSMIKNRL